MKCYTLICISLLFIFSINTVSSQNTLKAGTNGQIAFNIQDPAKNFAIGLTPPFKTKATDIMPFIAYSFLVSNGNLYILEYGNIVMQAGTVNLNDSIIIKRIGSEIKYYKNEIVVKTNVTNPNYDLSIYTLGENIPNIRATFDEALSSTAFVINLTANDTSNTGIIDINPTGGKPPYTYSWSNGATSKYLNQLGFGEYTVTITDAGGKSINQKVHIDYTVTAAVPPTFVLQNNLVIKHPDAVNDYEMMVSENTLTNGEWVEAVFAGDNASFIFGIDREKIDYDSAQNINYGLLCLDNELFFIDNGNVKSQLGTYTSNQSIMLKLNEDILEILIDGIKVVASEIEPQTYYSKVAMTKDAVGLSKWTTSKLFKPNGENDYYATLTKKLDGSFYEMKNFIKFKYDEKYNDTNLDYIVYNWKREIVMQNAGVSGHKYGVNYHRIPAYTILDSDQNGYYTLETTNDKGEVYKMRFYFIREVINTIPGIVYCCDENPEVYYDNTKKQKSAIVNPQTPIIITETTTTNERRK
jgi:hypothetical protein